MHAWFACLVFPWIRSRFNLKLIWLNRFWYEAGFQYSGGCDDETEQRVGAAARQKEILDRIELQKIEIKMRVFNAMVVPTLIYGCVRRGQYKRDLKENCKHLR